MSSKKTPDFDIDEYAALTKDCLETLDSDDLPLPRFDSGDESTNEPSRAAALFRKPVVLGVMALLSVNLLLLGIYTSTDSHVLTSAEATEQLQSTFLKDYELVESTEQFLAAADVSSNPKEKSFLDELDRFNTVLSTDSEEAGFKVEGFRFLRESFIYIDKEQ